MFLPFAGCAGLIAAGSSIAVARRRDSRKRKNARRFARHVKTSISLGRPPDLPPLAQLEEAFDIKRKPVLVM
jgi:hypothetical protein